MSIDRSHNSRSYSKTCCLIWKYVNVIASLKSSCQQYQNNPYSTKTSLSLINYACRIISCTNNNKKLIAWDSNQCINESCHAETVQAATIGSVNVTLRVTKCKGDKTAHQPHYRRSHYGLGGRNRDSSSVVRTYKRERFDSCGGLSALLTSTALVPQSVLYSCYSLYPVIINCLLFSSRSSMELRENLHLLNTGC